VRPIELAGQMPQKLSQAEIHVSQLVGT